MKFCFLSNLSMFFPIYIAYANGLVYVAGALLATMFLSMLYHCDEGNDAGLLVDVLGVIVAVTTLKFLMIQSTYILTPMNLVALVYGIASIICYLWAGEEPDSEQYENYHTAWHVLSSYFIAAFIYSHINTSVLEYNNSRLSQPILNININMNMRRAISPNPTSTSPGS